jgi:hypothetical protein
MFPFLRPFIAIIGKSQMEERERRNNQSHPPKEGVLRAVLTCQAQNRTAIPSKSGDGGYTLSLIGNATAMPVRLTRILRLI